MVTKVTVTLFVMSHGYQRYNPASINKTVVDLYLVRYEKGFVV